MKSLALWLVAGLAAGTACDSGDIEAPAASAQFTITLESVSAPDLLRPSDGSSQPVPISPGVWVVHTQADPLFAASQPDRGLGLEDVAEDGAPARLADALQSQVGVRAAGAFTTPLGDTGPGPATPGKRFVLGFVAVRGDKLSLATMFVPSNDLFYAPDGAGIDLFHASGRPVAGDVTVQLRLWDAGTELNQEPGLGPDQVQRQGAPDTGAADPDARVRPVADGYSYPNVIQVLRLTITSSPAPVVVTPPGTGPTGGPGA